MTDYLVFAADCRYTRGQKMDNVEKKDKEHQEPICKESGATLMLDATAGLWQNIFGLPPTTSMMLCCNKSRNLKEQQASQQTWCSAVVAPQSAMKCQAG